MIKNYEEAINYEDDLISGQQSKTIETEAAKLLQKLIMNIDGMLVSLFERTIENLKNIFTENNSEYNRERLELYYLELLLSAKALEERRYSRKANLILRRLLRTHLCTQAFNTSAQLKTHQDY